MSTERENLTKSKRYYLHKKVRDFVKLNPWSKCITIPQSRENELKQDPQWKYVKKLARAGYNIQYTIE